MEYDIIGDIHGQADKLEALLAQLGYTRAAAAGATRDARPSSSATSSTAARGSSRP